MRRLLAHEWSHHRVGDGLAVVGGVVILVAFPTMWTGLVIGLGWGVIIGMIGMDKHR